MYDASWVCIPATNVPTSSSSACRSATTSSGASTPASVSLARAASRRFVGRLAVAALERLGGRLLVVLRLLEEHLAAHDRVGHPARRLVAGHDVDRDRQRHHLLDQPGQLDVPQLQLGHLGQPERRPSPAPGA